MHDILYQYLILNKSLNLPGLGTIHLQKKSSHLDFGNKQISAPVYTFSLDNKNDKPSRKLFEWLAENKSITDWEAIKIVNDFSYDLKNDISKKIKVAWDHIGSFSRNEIGAITLDPVELTLEQPVVAERVIREKASHSLIVGETERTSEEMEEYFSETVEPRDYGWIMAIILVVASLMFAGWYFSENGLNLSATGNQINIFKKY